MMIGPHTNIALAIMMDPDFISRLSHLYIGAGHVYSEFYLTLFLYSYFVTCLWDNELRIRRVYIPIHLVGVERADKRASNVK